MTEEEALAEIALIDPEYPELAHVKADRILFALAPEAVRVKLHLLQQESDWFYA